MRYAVHKLNQRWHILDIEDGELIRDRRSRLVSYRAKISAENRVHELNGTIPAPGRYVLEAKGGFFYIRDMQVNKLVHDARGFLRVYANKARALSYMAKLNEGNADAEQAGE